MPPKIKRPAVVSAAFTIAACSLCSLNFNFSTVALAAVAAGICCALVFKRVLAAALAVVLALAAAAGFEQSMKTAASLEERFDKKCCTITGEVWKNPDIYEKSVGVILKTKDALVYVSIFDLDAQYIEIGDVLTFEGEYSLPALPKNDYAFNQREYLYAMKIYLTAQVKGDLHIQRASEFSIRRAAGKIQQNAAQYGEYRLSGDALGLYAASSFANKQFMSSDLKNDLRTAGLSHIAAVSGMHLSAVVSVISFLLYRLLGRGRKSAAVSAVAAIAFAFVTGWTPGVSRACIMCVIFMLSKILYREADAISSLSVAVTLMLAVNPMLIYSSALRLSALATAGILVFAPLLDSSLKKLAKPWRIVLSAAAVSVFAQLGVLWETARSFHSLPTYFILSNLLILPLLNLAVPMGISLPMVGQIPLLGKLWTALCQFLFGAIAYVTRKIARLPGAEIKIGEPGVLWFAAYLLLLILVYFALKRRKAALIWAGALALCLGANVAWDNMADKKAYLAFLNVGRGDCAVFLLPNDVTVVADCGSNAELLEDYLTASGRFKIDLMILTSDKKEHSGAARELAASFPIGQICLPEEGNWREVIACAEENGVRVETYSERTEFFVAKLRIVPKLYPCGVGIKAKYADAQIFLAPEGYSPWEKCNIVKLPNHGSGKYNYLNEAREASPMYAVLSANASAQEKSVCASTISKLNIPLYTTGKEGTVTFSLDDLSVSTTRTKKQRSAR